VRRDFDAALNLLEQGDVEPAIERLVGVTEAQPQLVAGHLNLGIAYVQTDEFEKAEKTLRQALALFPEHPAALNELGIALRHQGRFEEARRSYERALDVAPDFHVARRNLAILCDVFLSDTACALEHYERYAETAPDDEMVAMWIADLRNRSGKETR
jgi:Flp pilus assembly protein TadD